MYIYIYVRNFFVVLYYTYYEHLLLCVRSIVSHVFDCYTALYTCVRIYLFLHNMLNIRKFLYS